jgi:hypothetical protein
MVHAKLVFTDEFGQEVVSEVELEGSLERKNIHDLESLIVEAKSVLLKSSEQKLLELNQRLSIKKKGQSS